ncbi:MAG: hypothetical protein DRR42_16410 [Gammaproteobacteria bacterium]|nr:MAG: hypothetical protein DRR42_16410 [Gammaproteobacteria bacterium]
MARIIYCDDSQEIDGRSTKKLPFLVDRFEDPIMAVNHYLRGKYCGSATPFNTISRDARALNSWAENLEKGKRTAEELSKAWGSVNNAAIRLWGNKLAKSISQEDVDYHCSCVVRFYYWTRLQKYFASYQPIAGIIDIGAGKKYAVSLKGGSISAVWTEGIMGTPAPGNHAYVSDEDVDGLTEQFIENANKKADPKLAELADALLVRNCLIVDVMDLSGLRRFEVAKLSIDDLPSKEKVKAATLKGVMMPVSVIGKRNKRRWPDFHPQLLEQLWEHIENGRKDILTAKNRKAKIESKDVFLSVKTGRGMLPGSINEILKGVPPHALRRRAATKAAASKLADAQLRQSETGVITDDATIITQVQRMLGHSSADTTTKGYLQLAKEEQMNGESKKPYMEEIAIKMLVNKNRLLERKLNKLQSSKKNH